MVNNSIIYAGDTNGNVSVLDLDTLNKKNSFKFGLSGPIRNLAWNNNSLTGIDGGGDLYLADFYKNKNKL